MWMNLQKNHDLAKASEGFDTSKLTCLTHLWKGQQDDPNKQEPENE
jgi:plasmid maintenance system antidote protein VapI